MKYRYTLHEPSFCVGNIDIQSVSRPKGYRHSFPFGREKHGFIYIMDGSMDDCFRASDKKVLHASKGDLIFIPKGSVYTGEYLEDGTSIRIVQFDLLVGELPSYLSEPVKLELPRAYELIDAFFSGVLHGAPPPLFYCLARLYDLLLCIDECHAGVPQKYKKLAPALQELSEYWNKNEKVSYYADLCCMSEPSFRRLFHECVGMSPIEYRNDLRLSHARSWLQSGEYNVSEVCYQSGFSNLSFFIRAYKKKYGHTPLRRDFGVDRNREGE